MNRTEIKMTNLHEVMYIPAIGTNRYLEESPV